MYSFGEVIDGNTVGFVVWQTWFGISSLPLTSFVKLDKQLEHSEPEKGGLLKWRTVISASWYSCLCIILSPTECELHFLIINRSLFLTFLLEAGKFEIKVPADSVSIESLQSWFTSDLLFLSKIRFYKSLWLLTDTLTCSLWWSQLACCKQSYRGPIYSHSVGEAQVTWTYYWCLKGVRIIDATSLSSQNWIKLQDT